MGHQAQGPFEVNIASPNRLASLARLTQDACFGGAWPGSGLRTMGAGTLDSTTSNGPCHQAGCTSAGKQSLNISLTVVQCLFNGRLTVIWWPLVCHAVGVKLLMLTLVFAIGDSRPAGPLRSPLHGWLRRSHGSGPWLERTTLLIGAGGPMPNKTALRPLPLQG